jgi:hypothetical protein
VSEIKGLRVKFYFSRDVASGEKIWSSKRGGGINTGIVFGQLYTPLQPIQMGYSLYYSHVYVPVRVRYL